MAQVNLDVAMESTSQKILSKIANVADQPHKYSVTTVKTSTGTPFSVTGKGRLYYAYIHHSVGGANTGTLTITVDGTTILTLSTTSGGTAGQSSLVHLGNPHFMDNGMNYFGVYPVEMNTTEFVEELSVDNRISESFDGGETFCAYISPYIEFHESIEIKMTKNNTSSGSTAYVCYSLAEV